MSIVTDMPATGKKTRANGEAPRGPGEIVEPEIFPPEPDKSGRPPIPGSEAEPTGALPPSYHRFIIAPEMEPDRAVGRERSSAAESGAGLTPFQPRRETETPLEFITRFRRRLRQGRAAKR